MSRVSTSSLHAPLVPSPLPIIRSISSSPRSPSAFPLALRLPSAVNLRYPSLSGIHYRFYWGQSRQTDRVQRRTDGGNEAGGAGTPGHDGASERTSRMRVDHATALFHSGPPPPPLRRRRRRRPLALLRCAAPARDLGSRALRRPCRLSSPRGDGSRPDL